jgi:hypothetical protein
LEFLSEFTVEFVAFAFLAARGKNEDRLILGGKEFIG